MELIQSLALYIVCLLIGFSLHEAGHAYAANYLGDRTARNMGRLTLNPLAHLDLFGTIILPLMMIIAQLPIIMNGGFPLVFAAAKPVPVVPGNFKRPKADFAFVAAAGPMVNIVLCFLGAFLLNFTNSDGSLARFLDLFIWVNVVLAFFNLFPCPPLDGSKIIAGFLPRSIAEQIISLDRVGFLLILGLILIGRQMNFNVFGTWILFWREAFQPSLFWLSNLF